MKLLLIQTLWLLAATAAERPPMNNLPDLAIVANSVTSSGFTVTWKPIGGVGAYKVRVYQQNDASKTVLESVVTSTAFTATKLAANMIYEIRVDGWEKNEPVPYSGAVNARTVPAGVQITNHVTTPHVITVFLEQTPGVTKWVVAMKEVGSNASHTLQDLPSSEENFKHSYVATFIGLKSNTKYEFKARAAQMFSKQALSEAISPFGSPVVVTTDKLSVFVNGLTKESYSSGSGTNKAERERQLLAVYKSNANTTARVTAVKIDEMSDSNGMLRCFYEISVSDAITGVPELADLKSAASTLYTQQRVTPAELEPIEFVYYIRKGLLQYGTNGESNGKSVIQWKLCDSSGTDNQVATVTVADLSIQSRYFVDFTDEKIHIHLKEDQNRKEVADLDLKSNSVYAVRQDYSYKLVNVKEPSKTRYGRQFRTSYNMHLKGSQNMIVHDTGVTNFTFAPLTVTPDYAESAAIVRFDGKLLKRVAKYEFQYNGRTVVVNDTNLDSSDVYTVKLGELGNNRVTNVTVTATTRSINQELKSVTSTFSIAQCLPKHTSITYGSVACSNVNFGKSICTFNCETEGYGLAGGVKQLTCGENGLWSAATPKCERIRCKPLLTSLTHGRVQCTETNLLHSKCTYSCNEFMGFVNTAHSTVTCQDDKDGDATGSWSQTSPPVCREITCSPVKLLPPKNGAITCTRENRGGSACKYTCDETYAISNPTYATSVCQDDGDRNTVGGWSLKGKEPTCIKITCPEHAAFDYGVKKCSDSRNVGSECTYMCDASHVISHAERAKTVCKKKNDFDRYGMWTQKAPLCTSCSQSCHANGECFKANSGAWQCKCSSGYEGDGVTCCSPTETSPDICENADCNANRKCFKTGQGEKSIVYKCEPCLVSSPGSCTNRTRECAYCSSTSTDGGADCFEFTARCSYYQYERELRCDCAENYFVEDGACQPRREVVFCSGFCLPGIVLGVTLLLSLLTYLGYRYHRTMNRSLSYDVKSRRIPSDNPSHCTPV